MSGTQVQLRGGTVACTIAARNYLAQVSVLIDSVRSQHPDWRISVLIVDGDAETCDRLAKDGVEVDTLRSLGLGEQETEELATIYDVVELSTAVKPLYLRKLLVDARHAVYLDPDMYVVSPMTEVEDGLQRHSCLLTPHFLQPVPENAHISESHALTVGVFNLGFCAVGRDAVPLLDWWWRRLQRDCLKYPLLGLFVDQKWMDLGASLYQAYPLRHAGYNVGPWNLHERQVHVVDGRPHVSKVSEPLRLLHFSGFDPEDPGAISSRLNIDMSGLGLQSDALLEIASDYAARVRSARETFSPSVTYGFAKDSSGRPLSRRIRQAYRSELLAATTDASLPPAFAREHAQAFANWRARSIPTRVKVLTADTAIAAKYAFPDTFERFRAKFSKSFSALRSHLLDANGIRR